MKSELRKEIIKKRYNYNSNNASKVCFDALIISNIINKFEKIGIYYPIKNEIDIMPIVDYYPNKKFYLPVTKDELEFHRYTGELTSGPFKTLEPTGELIARDEIECFIIPCLGINKDMKRLGYGKGYYDRYLMGYKGLKIGICYKVDSNLDIKLDSYDLVLDMKISG